MPSTFIENLTAGRCRLCNLLEMKHLTVILLLILFLPFALAGATYTVDEVPNVHVADSSAYVSDPDGILTARECSRINELMREVRRTTSAEPMFVIVENIDPEDIDEFATGLFSKWGLGKGDTDNGLLVLVARDMRRAVIRTGYGLEGVMPDIVCSGILKNRMFPDFRRGDYGAGLVSAAEAVNEILTNPEAAAEFRSSERDADFGGKDGGDDFFASYMALAGMIAFVLLAVFLFRCYAIRRKTPQERYLELAKLKPVYLALTFFGLGLPIIASLPLLLTLKHLRNRPHHCPRCGARMRKVDEVHGNEYLSRSQDFEERIGSVDYDVWLCPDCGETDIEQYVTPSTGIRQCPVCHAYAGQLLRKRVVIQPTTSRKGQGMNDYVCRCCGHIESVPYIIPMLVAPIIFPGGGGGGGFGGGGGSFGGGFGGGMTGGGGASGGW